MAHSQCAETSVRARSAQQANFNVCEMEAVIGAVRRVKVPRAERSALRQMDSLQLFAAACKKAGAACSDTCGIG